MEFAFLPFQVGDGNFQHARCDDLRLVAYPAGDQGRGRTRHRCGPAAVGAQPERCLVGIAVHDVDVVGRDAQFFGDDLRERRLMSLALGLNRKPHHGFAGRVHPQLTSVGHAEAEDVHVLARAGADGLGEEGHADAHQLALLPSALLFLTQSVIADHVHGLTHGGLCSHPSGRPSRSCSCRETALASTGFAAAARPDPSSARRPGSPPGAPRSTPPR